MPSTQVLSWLLVIGCVGAVVLHAWLAGQVDPAAAAPSATIHAWTHTPSALSQQILLGGCAAALLVVAALTHGFSDTGGWRLGLYVVTVVVSVIALAPVVVALALLGITIVIGLMAPIIAVAVAVSALKRR
ncbi:hypothetical protein [Nocardia sp. AG03]|uniref:hypothetical protein n=1 Tax=Nocardia sp. AG03 TaxID=3025312 RepID=UPI0024187EE9|nr:hypothetical protein [Nocardia sp. AG03]